MFSTLWAAPASNSAAVSSRCCLLQRCPLPILSFPKENAHWWADFISPVISCAQISPFPRLQSIVQTWTGMKGTKVLVYISGQDLSSVFLRVLLSHLEVEPFLYPFAGSCQICLVHSLHWPFWFLLSLPPNLAVPCCLLLEHPRREVNCLIKRFFPFGLQLFLLSLGSKRWGPPGDLYIGGDNVSFVWDLVSLRFQWPINALGQHAHLVWELGKHRNRTRNYWKIIPVSRNNDKDLVIVSSSSAPPLKYCSLPPLVLETPYNLLISGWAWMWANIPSIPWYLLYVGFRYPSRIMEDGKGQGSRHFLCMSVAEPLCGRLVMVHSKAERDHVWESAGRSAKHSVGLSAGVLWLLWDPREQFCKKGPKKIILRTEALVVHPA